jgi:spermidine/putrescine transport system substrate-binding protein
MSQATRLSRRELLGVAGRGAASLGMMSFLAACGVSATGSRSKVKGLRVLPPKAGELSVASWPGYIDQDQKTKTRPSVDQFTSETGIKVTYKEVIDDNQIFFGTVRETLARGGSTGWDLYVISDWLVTKHIQLGYLEELHLDRIPNFTTNAAAIYKSPDYDPGSRHSIPWQAGLTGIAYNRKRTGRDLTSFDDLFDPRFKKKVGMMTEMRDTVNLALLAAGVDLQKATTEDVKQVQKRLLKQKKDGIVRAYYGNEYVDALAHGDLWACMAWSGDVLSLVLDNPDLRFVIPREGGIVWVDAMVIPKGAEHPTDAHEWMNFYYRPEIAAGITEVANFVSPVPAAQDVLRTRALAAEDPDDRATLEDLVNSPLVFPTAEMQKRLHYYKQLTEAEEKEWNDLFQEVTQG